MKHLAPEQHFPGSQQVVGGDAVSNHRWMSQSRTLAVSCALHFWVAVVVRRSRTKKMKRDWRSSSRSLRVRVRSRVRVRVRVRGDWPL